jgi:hypothetical protein
MKLARQFFRLKKRNLHTTPTKNDHTWRISRHEYKRFQSFLRRFPPSRSRNILAAYTFVKWANQQSK